MWLRKALLAGISAIACFQFDKCPLEDVSHSIVTVMLAKFRPFFRLVEEGFLGADLVPSLLDVFPSFFDESKSLPIFRGFHSCKILLHSVKRITTCVLNQSSCSLPLRSSRYQGRVNLFVPRNHVSSKTYSPEQHRVCHHPLHAAHSDPEIVADNETNQHDYAEHSDDWREVV